MNGLGFLVLTILCALAIVAALHEPKVKNDYQDH